MNRRLSKIVLRVYVNSFGDGFHGIKFGVDNGVSQSRFAARVFRVRVYSRIEKAFDGDRIIEPDGFEKAVRIKLKTAQLQHIFRHFRRTRSLAGRTLAGGGEN